MASDSPTIAGQALESQASAASGQSNRRRAPLKISPARCIGSLDSNTAREWRDCRGSRRGARPDANYRFRTAPHGTRDSCAHNLGMRKLSLLARLSAASLFQRRYRLRVRTWPSQGQNPGSNPGIATKSSKRPHKQLSVSRPGALAPPQIRVSRCRASGRAPTRHDARQGRRFPG
jgi:hypothetical protein